MQIAKGPGSSLRRPLAVTVIGGLLMSQLLTVYFTPVLYVWLGGLRRRQHPPVEKSLRRERPDRIASFDIEKPKSRTIFGP